jgi:hypothetical protein
MHTYRAVIIFMSFRRLDGKAFSFETHDGLQPFVVMGFVILSFVFSRVAIGMSLMEGGISSLSKFLGVLVSL